MHCIYAMSCHVGAGYNVKAWNLPKGQPSKSNPDKGATVFKLSDSKNPYRLYLKLLLDMELDEEGAISRGVGKTHSKNNVFN